MRRTALIGCMLATAVFVPSAAAHEGPVSHGPDPASIDGAAPSGSPRARASAAASTGLPTTWCGDERTSDSTQNELANGDFRYHAVYAVPSDAPSRLQSVAGRIQADAMRATGLIEQLYGRAIRFDMGTSCGPQYLDVSVVRLPQTTAQLQNIANSDTGTLDAVTNALDSSGFRVIKASDTFAAAAARTRNWVVWLDGPAPAGACGQAMLYDDAVRSQENYNNLAGKVAVVFRGAEGFCGANSIRHEIAHNLGAVVSRAPNSNGGHCTDAIEDTMCTPEAPAVAGGAYHALYFDYGNDDYWDPPSGRALPWWTVNLSRFVCPDSNCNIPPGYVPPAQPPATSGSPAASSRTTARRARVQLRARRLGRRWRIVLRARGRGTAVVTVRCRRSRGRPVRVAWRKRAHLPRTYRRRVICASRPRAVALYETRA